jgi:hypothetical protein
MRAAGVNKREALLSCSASATRDGRAAQIWFCSRPFPWRRCEEIQIENAKQHSLEFTTKHGSPWTFSLDAFRDSPDIKRAHMANMFAALESYHAFFRHQSHLVDHKCRSLEHRAVQYFATLARCLNDIR